MYRAHGTRDTRVTVHMHARTHVHTHAWMYAVTDGRAMYAVTDGCAMYAVTDGRATDMWRQVTILNPFEMDTIDWADGAICLYQVICHNNSYGIAICYND